MKRNKPNLALSKKSVGMPNLIKVPPLETSFESLESLIEIRRRYKNEKKQNF